MSLREIYSLFLLYIAQNIVTLHTKYVHMTHFSLQDNGQKQDKHIGAADGGTLAA